MWRNFRVFLFILLLTSLSACDGAVTPEAPLNSPQVIKIGLPPTLAYLKDQLSTCANADPTYDILLLEKNSSDWMREPVDMMLTLQDAVPGSTNTFLIQEIEVVLIAGKSFPLKGLTIEQLKSIYNADSSDTQQTGLPAGFLPVIWGFEPHSDMADLFTDQFLFSPQLPDDAHLAVSPQSMLESIAQSTEAIGYTLSPLVTNQVKLLPITDKTEPPSIPVIASFKLPPSPVQETLLRCLQNPTK
jgi:hypothetical protein